MSEALQLPPPMNVAEFVDWDAPGPERWQLVDGQPMAMAPASLKHNGLQQELSSRLWLHFRESGRPCSVVPTPGIIPHIRANQNFRIPDLGVSCAANAFDGYALPEPVLLIEILSPSNARETWANVWAYTTIPSVREILVLRATAPRAELLRRGADQSWPTEPESIEDGDLVLESIGFRMSLRELYSVIGVSAPS